jgi:hypothetical protein
MNARFLLISASVILAAAVLLCVGGLGAIELATAECGANGYLCVPQQPARHDLDYAALMRAEQRVGLR